MGSCVLISLLPAYSYLPKLIIYMFFPCFLLHLYIACCKFFSSGQVSIVLYSKVFFAIFTVIKAMRYLFSTDRSISIFSFCVCHSIYSVMTSFSSSLIILHVLQSLLCVSHVSSFVSISTGSIILHFFFHSSCISPLSFLIALSRKSDNYLFACLCLIWYNQ